MTTYCQNDEYGTIVRSIANKVENKLNHKYYISGIEIDKSINNPTEARRKIRDPYHTLAGCFLFLAKGQEIDNRGFIGLYRSKTDSIIWQSVLLSDDFSRPQGRVEETTELNKDGKVEIIIAQGKEPVMTEQLWIFSWDGTEGKLITQLDEYGESMIMEFGEYYELKDVDGDGIYEILGEWYKDNNSENKTTITYSWNGSVYGKWGKSSKYLLRKKHR
jgi:hypothetical protein